MARKKKRMNPRRRTSPALPAMQLELYEGLRAAVLRGQARAGGLGAIVFHGLWRGPGRADHRPQRRRRQAIAAGVIRRRHPAAMHDRQLVRLLANMVLAAESQVTPCLLTAAMKVGADHLRRDAFLYVRQSSLRQVFENTESTKRQYALRERAVALGWPIERVHVIDSDLGLSGAQAQRPRRLPAPGHRGGDGPRRHRAGAGGVAPGAQQRRLAPPARAGGAVAHAHPGRGRHLRPGALQRPPAARPEGHDERGRAAHPEVAAARRHPQQGAARRARDAAADRAGLRPPTRGSCSIRTARSRTRCGSCSTPSARPARPAPWCAACAARRSCSRGASVAASARATCCGAPSTISRVLQILHNPRYAGAFAYGRTRTAYNAKLKPVQLRVQRSDWKVLIPDAHEGYISWAEYERNQVTLRAERERLLAGPARSHAAPGQCAAAGAGAVRPLRGAHAGALRAVRRTAAPVLRAATRPSCATPASTASGSAAPPVDEAVGALLLQTVAPAAIEVALAVQQEIAQRVEQAAALREAQLQRARYEAELARRRYAEGRSGQPVGGRRAGGRLERSGCATSTPCSASTSASTRPTARCWTSRRANASGRWRATSPASGTTTAPARSNASACWPAHRGRDAARRRPGRRPCALARRTHAEPGVARPRPIRADPQDRRRRSWRSSTSCSRPSSDQQIAARLNELGHRNWRGEPFTMKKVMLVRRAYALSSRFERLRERGMLTGEEVARQLGVSSYDRPPARAAGRPHATPLRQQPSMLVRAAGQRQTRQGRRQPIWQPARRGSSPLNLPHKVHHEVHALSRGLRGPRRHARPFVVRRHLGVGPVDRGLVEAGLGDAGLQVVGHDLRRHAAEPGQRPAVRADPVRQALRPVASAKV